MNQDNYIVEALNIVSALNIPNEEFIQKVSDQANLLAMVNPDELWEDLQDIH